MSIGIAGAGAFGTALAIAIARQGREVTLWARDADMVRDMAETRQNAARLPGIELPETVTVTDELGDLSACGTILLSVPAQALDRFLDGARTELDEHRLVACCKGIDLGRLVGPSGIIAARCPDATAAVLTGPSFASDIAKGLPTALTLACADAEAGEAMQAELATDTLRLYRTTDVTGAELGGALKNVTAIACGVAVGAGLGESARAALVTRGFAEMRRLATDLGARPATLSGLSGFGDLVLTCTSEQSRNYRYGQSLGAGADFDRTITVEGASTAKAVTELARHRGIDMPICAAVAELVTGRTTVARAMQDLLSRPLKEE